jgi:hypothetical protein
MISFSKEALEIVTDAQRKKLIDLDDSDSRDYLHPIEVIRAFDLPEGYVSVSIPYNTGIIYGGIAPDGVMST